MKTNIKKACPRCGKRMKLIARQIYIGHYLWECPNCKLTGWDNQMEEDK